MGYQELINKNIKNLRIKNGLTQEEFSEKINISIQGLSNIERNRYQPTEETIDRICRVFNITPAELLYNPKAENSEIIQNINVLLSDLSNQKLEKIYEIIKILAKFH